MSEARRETASAARPRRLLLAVVLAGAAGAASAESQPGRPPGLPEKAHVARALFTTAVVDREPVDEVLVLDTRDGQVLFFTDLRHLQGRTVTHRWKHEGKVVAEVPFRVGGPRWRVYSRKTLGPGAIGRWTVVVVDKATEWPLAAAVLEYREPAEDGSSRVILRRDEAAPSPSDAGAPGDAATAPSANPGPDATSAGGTEATAPAR